MHGQNVHVREGGAVRGLGVTGQVAEESREIVDRVLRKVRNAIEKHRMFGPGDGVLIGLSGGPDSVALLDVLATLAPELGLRLQAAHLNHMLRGKAADEDEEFSSRLAERYGIPIVRERADAALYAREHGLSPEDAARAVRYAFFTRVAAERGLSKLALGHNLDDQAETVLLRLIRGAGVPGLGGIHPVRVHAGTLTVVRPLLLVGREEILGYLAARGLDYRIDASNLEPVYRRNFVRLSLIPAIEREINPSVKQVLARTADLAREDEEFLTEAAERAFERVKLGPRMAPDCQDVREDVRLDLDGLLSLHGAVLRRVILLACRAVLGDLVDIYTAHVEDVVELVRNGRTGSVLILPRGLRVARGYGEIRFGYKRITATDDVSNNVYLLGVPGSVRLEGFVIPVRAPRDAECRSACCAPGGRAPEGGWDYEARGVPVMEARVVKLADRWASDGLNPSVIVRAVREGLDASDVEQLDPTVRGLGERWACFDYDLLPESLAVRSRRPGDRFLPFGAPGERKLKEFLIDAKVPSDIRDRIPLLVSGEDTILWVAGLRSSEKRKVTSSTRRMLVVWVRTRG